MNPTGITIWLTGLSGSGKSTLSESLKKTIDFEYNNQIQTFILDGDVIRKGLNSNLGFTKEDRQENIRRISEVSKLFNMSGQIVIVAFISPYAEDREYAKRIHKESNLKFVEVYVSTSLEECERRDVKGLYAKARRGEIPNFTGVSDPYQAPEKADLVLNTEGRTVDSCVDDILIKLYDIGFFQSKPQHLSIVSKENHMIEVSEEEFNWLQCFQLNWLPKELKCFMNEKEYLECLYFKTYKESLLSLPIIFPINITTKKDIDDYKLTSKTVTLTYKSKEVCQLSNLQVYPFNPEELSGKIFGITSFNHPKANRLIGKTHLLTGDDLIFKERLGFNDGLDNYRLSSSEVINEISNRKADCVYAFQLRNPLHNGHVLLLNDTRKMLISRGYTNPILLLHPCGGWTKDDDVPLKTRIQQHEALLSDGTLNKDTTILSIWPSPMFYAGPAEVLFHFSSRVNANVDFMIVGRDPAGIKHPIHINKDLFDPSHGGKVLDIAREKGLLKKMQILPFKVAVYNKEAKEMEYYNEENKSKYENISGSKMRQLARENSPLPVGFMNDKGWEILVEYYKSLN